MTVLEKNVLEILTEDARVSPKKISAMLSKDEAEITACISQMEQSGLIVKYTAIVDVQKADDSVVDALIEVKSVYLMSGAYDLAVMIEDRSLQQVARFVSERISTFDGVISTATHFILKKYKIEGTITERENADYRILVQP